MKKKIPLLLIAIFALTYFLRVMYLPQDALTFGYDQARDAFIVRDLLSGDVKVQGPPSSTEGLFHGVFYYYALAPGYLLGQGSPMIAAYWIAFLNAITVFVIFYLVDSLTGKKSHAFIASFLFAISFQATQYATWLSNPTLAVLTLPLGYLGLWLWLKKKVKWAPYVAALGLGLSIQAELFLAYHLIPFSIWLVAERKRIKQKDFLKFTFAFLFSVASMIIAQVKFGIPKTIEGILSLLTTEDFVLQGKSLGDFVILYLNQIGNTFSNSIFPTNPGWGGAFGVILLIIALRQWMRKKKETLSWEPFIATYVLAHLSVVSFGGVSSPFLTVGIGVAAIILAGIMIGKVWENNKILASFILLILTLSSVSTVVSENKKGQVMFSIQNDFLISNEKQVLDFTYQEAEGENFSINTTTSPLWVNTTWSYLYNWYGLEKYGYLPHWHGRDQVGRLGNNLPDVTKDIDMYFYIVEPPQNIMGKFLEDSLAAENARSSIVKEAKYGEIEVQKRVPLED